MACGGLWNITCTLRNYLNGGSTDSLRREGVILLVHELVNKFKWRWFYDYHYLINEEDWKKNYSSLKLLQLHSSFPPFFPRKLSQGTAHTCKFTSHRAAVRNKTRTSIWVEANKPSTTSRNVKLGQTFGGCTGLATTACSDAEIQPYKEPSEWTTTLPMALIEAPFGLRPLHGLWITQSR